MRRGTIIAREWRNLIQRKEIERYDKKRELNNRKIM